jgi:hypothetical protein
MLVAVTKRWNGLHRMYAAGGEIRVGPEGEAVEMGKWGRGGFEERRAKGDGGVRLRGGDGRGCGGG